MNYVFDWSVVLNHQTFLVFLNGLKLTLIVSGSALVFGSIIGLAAALARHANRAPLSQIAYFYIDIFRTTPPLVQLIWIYYVAPLLLGIDVTAVVAGIAALSLNSGAFLAEAFRSGIQSVERGQHDATTVLGLTRVQTYRHVILPQAMRRVLPAVTSIFMSLLKDSALLSVIGVTELTYGVQGEVAQTFRPFELYSALAVAYLCLTYPFSLIASMLERRHRES
jgi:His/Glu/Gln/Arg/opine family amino acid ABC transporter permease subunit